MLLQRRTRHVVSLGAVSAMLVASACGPTPTAGPPASPPAGAAIARHSGFASPAGGRPTMWVIPSGVDFSNSGPLPANATTAIPLYQPYLDQFAWETFIAVNWPALPSGEPNEATWIGARGDGPTVWEHWMNASDVFRPHGEPPLPWGQRTPIPPSCPKPKQTTVFVFDEQSSQTHNMPFAEPGTSLEETATGPLIDQSRRFTFFEVYLNRTAYDYINDNTLYSREGQAEFKRQGKSIAFPSRTKVAPGTMEIKAAWKILGDAPVDSPSNWHTASGVFIAADGSCTVKTVGMTAMHVSYLVDYEPNRIWSTFENLNDLCTQAQDGTYSSGAYCNAACITNPAGPGCMPPNTPPPRKEWKPPPDPTQPGTALPTQVVRVQPLPATSLQINMFEEGFLSQIDGDSVWAQYQLIDTQWALPLASDLNTSTFRAPLVYPNMGPAPQFIPRLKGGDECDKAAGKPQLLTRACAGLVVPSMLANTMVETYIQPGASCIGCHETAKDSVGSPADFDFVLRRARGRADK
jgi:hypothetical protein